MRRWLMAYLAEMTSMFTRYDGADGRSEAVGAVSGGDAGERPRAAA